MPPTPLQLATLRALLDRLIPGDDFPGALAAGTDHYVLRQLTGDCAAEAPALWTGLTQLDAEASARHGRNAAFATLTISEQDQLLLALEKNRPATKWPAAIPAAIFFNRFVDLAHEGFYADPANGGNRSAASWRMLNYDPRIPNAGATPPR